MADYRENAKWTVYVHISPSNKYYVGITKRDPKVRWRNGEGYIKNEYFYRAIQKYSWNNFEHEIVASNLTEDEAKKFEIALIRELKSNDWHYGYNISSGGEGKSGVPTSELHKKVTSERLKKCWQNPEYRKKMSEISQHDDEWKANHSRIIKEKWKDPEYRKKCGVMKSPIAKGDKRPDLLGENNGNAKSVVCLNTRIEYGCMKDAAENTGANASTIGECCHGKAKTSGIDNNGMKLLWVFKEDFEKMSQDDIDKKIKDANKRHGRLVVNLTNKELFVNSSVAAEKYGVNNPCSINTVCREGKGKIKNCNWQYYEDYLKENNLTDEEVRKSLIFID